MPCTGRLDWERREESGGTAAGSILTHLLCTAAPVWCTHRRPSPAYCICLHIQTVQSALPWHALKTLLSTILYRSIFFGDILKCTVCMNYVFVIVHFPFFCPLHDCALFSCFILFYNFIFVFLYLFTALYYYYRHHPLHYDHYYYI